MANAAALVAHPHPSSIPFYVKITANCGAICRELMFDEPPIAGEFYAARRFGNVETVIVQWPVGGWPADRIEPALLGKVTAFTIEV